MHLAVADFPLRRPNALSLEGWRKLFGECRARADEVRPGLADELASAASLLMGQADESLPVVHATGLPFALREGAASELIRSRDTDIFR